MNKTDDKSRLHYYIFLTVATLGVLLNCSLYINRKLDYLIISTIILLAVTVFKFRYPTKTKNKALVVNLTSVIIVVLVGMINYFTWILDRFTY